MRSVHRTVHKYIGEAISKVSSFRNPHLIEKAVQAGTFCRLLNLIPDRILELTEHGLVEYKGKFDYYLEKTGRVSPAAAEEKKPGRTADEELELTRKLVTDSEARRKAGKQQEAEQRRRERRAEACANRIHEIEGEIADIQDEMSLPENSTDVAWMHEKSALLAELEAEVTRLYDEWMELQ